MTHRMLFFSVVLFLSQSHCTQNSKLANNTFAEVEADEIDIASRLAGRVKKILVTPGQRVKAGDVLVEFEDDVMAVKRRGAEATIAAAESKRNMAQDAVRPEEKEQLKAAVAAAKKQTAFAKTTLDRSKQLVKEGAISQQQLDEIEFKYQASLEQSNAAEAKLRMAEIGARPEEKAGAQALVDQATTILSEVEAYQKDMNLTSPIDGEIAQILSHEGELVPVGYPVITVVKIDDPWVTVSLPETKLKDFPMDKIVTVAIPALNNKTLQGKVSYIAAMANFATKTFTQDRSSFDLKTFEIHLTLTGKLDGLRPGMTAILK